MLCPMPNAPQRALRKPYLLFLGDVQSEQDAKTAFGLRDWSRADCVGQLRLPEATVSVGLADLSPREAYALGARSLVIGVAPDGGAIPPSWYPTLFAATEAGLDIVSGLHTRLASIAGLATAAQLAGTRLEDIRHTERSFAVGAGSKRS